jgi:ferritin
MPSKPKSKKTQSKTSKTNAKKRVNSVKKSLISKKTIELLQYRIQEEENSSRVYLSMSMWLENEGFLKAKKLWKKFSVEEVKHADWAREYLLSFGILPETPSLKKVNSNYKDFPDIIKKTFEHEILITHQLEELAKHSRNISDNMLYTLAEKYLAEQIEEHNKTQTLMDQLKSFGTNKIAMRLFNSSLNEINK